MSDPNLSAFIWSVADLLRGDYKQSEYGKVILPFTVLRRLDCVLAPTKDAVLAERTTRLAQGMNPEPFLLRKAGQTFYNTSTLDMKRLMGDPDNIAANLYAYIQAFSPDVRDIFERFEFAAQVDRLAKSGLLYQVIEKFTQIDLHPTSVDNHPCRPDGRAGRCQGHHLCRAYRDTQGKDAGTVRQATRPKSAGRLDKPARGVPRLFDAAGHRRGVHPRRSAELHAL